jgi:SAM-dependent methyltransferase
MSPTWPKVLPPLTPEQERISNDFVGYWHQVLPRRYGFLDTFNHTYPIKHAGKDFERTLDIGAGTGEHVEYESLLPSQRSNYVAVDIRQNMVAEFKRRFPDMQAILGDCQKRLSFPDGHFDRIMAIHVLEHLPNLPAAIREAHRLCDKDRGRMSVVIPCEGSFAYSLARRISAQRIFEKRYGQSYAWFIKREHLNRPSEILAEIAPYFDLVHRTSFPIPFRAEFCNLAIGATFTPKKQ